MHRIYQQFKNFGPNEESADLFAIRDLTAKDDVDKEESRGSWSHPAEFILSCLGYAVGLGNVWRFPYVCFINGGGAFLIPYVIMLALVGIPAFFLELIVGQYSGKGPLHVWDAAPIFKGLGLSILFINSMVMIFYTMVMGYALYYFVLSFYNPQPWDTCQHAFNTLNCYNKGEATPCEATDNGTWFNNTCYNATYLSGFTETTEICNGTQCDYIDYNPVEEYLNNATRSAVSSAEEYLNIGVLQMSSGIEHPGGMVWQLVCALLAGWVICYFCLIKGIRSTGKVVYFTATFPYIILTILLIYGSTLPGSYDGIVFYLKPDWNKLKSAKVWADAASQIFFTLGVGTGGLMTFASYNKFNNNIYRDTLIVSIGNCLTSFYSGFAVFAILGYMAKILGRQVKDVVVDGSTLAFVAYPTALSRMPVSQLWGVLFFFMLVMLAIDSLFAGMECNITAVVDSLPRLRPHKSLVALAVCIVFFILGLSMTTQAGIYWLSLIAYYATGWSLIIVGLLEVIVFAWFYGASKLRAHAKEMCGFSIGIHWWILWTLITPLLLIAIFVFAVVDFVPLAFGPYKFPTWATTIGWIIALCPVGLLIIVAVIVIIKTRITIQNDTGVSSHTEILTQLFRPSPSWGPSNGHSQDAETIIGENSKSHGMEYTHQNEAFSSNF